jgi:phenylalanyl-tRNA synthetase beta chain
VIGIETPADDQKRWLERLEFETTDGEVVAPTWRARDITREVDVVEEVARERLEEVPFTLPTRSEMFGAFTPLQRLRRRVEDALSGLGLAETYTPTLRAEDTDLNALRLPEPITVELSVLRTRLLPSLVEAARRNLELGAERIALFEVARAFLPADDLPDERTRVAAIVEGDFSRAKGIVETLYAAINAEPEFERAEDPLLHPGKAARTGAGVLGDLMPGVLEGTWGAFELDLATLLDESRDPAYEDVITYPPVRQDLAFAVADDVSAGELVIAAREAAGPELREMRAFDVYRGEQLGEGRKSIAFAVVFQSPERTLSDEDAAGLRERIAAALADRYGAELRAS